MSPTKKNTSLTKLIAESKGRPLEILIQVLKKKIKQKFCLHIAEANLKTNDIVKKKKIAFATYGPNHEPKEIRRQFCS